MKVAYKYFPADIHHKYILQEKVHQGYIYMKIKGGMYGLKQAAILAYESVYNLLTTAGYTPILGSLGLWKHKTNSITFCLCVDDFGVKYSDKKDLRP